MSSLNPRLLTGIGLMLGGAVVAVAGYLGVSRELEVAFQIPYLASAGVGAVLLVGAGSAVMISAHLERDTARLDELEESVRLLAGELGRLADQLETVAPHDDVVDVVSTNGRSPEGAVRT